MIELFGRIALLAALAILAWAARRHAAERGLLRPRGARPPAWFHHKRHYWQACVREWFGQPEGT